MIGEVEIGQGERGLDEAITKRGSRGKIGLVKESNVKLEFLYACYLHCSASFRANRQTFQIA